VLLSTAAAENLPEAHERLYTAAKSSGVQHIVRISALGASPSAPIKLMQLHGEAERALEESGIGWTHLRPQSFMQNFLGSATTIMREGKIYNCTGEGRVPFVDVRDIAASAVTCLTKPGHMGNAYEITGPQAITMRQVAESLTRGLDRTVEYVDLPADTWIAAVTAAGLPEWGARDLAWLHVNVFAKNLAESVTPSVKELTGRESLSIDDFVRDHAPAFRGVAS
jgi:uncharacterized protein YbjT (DUF2867 family)